MKLHNSFARLALAAALIIFAGAIFLPCPTWAQADMQDMPDRVSEATPALEKSAPDAMTNAEMQAMPDMTPTTEKSAAPKPQAEMDSMPEMTTAKKESSASPEDMSGMLGMNLDAATKANAMDAMPGMTDDRTPSRKSMEGMPGMAPDSASAPMRISKPGVTILRPPQKWVLPPGDDRANELLSRPALEGFMNPLPPPIEDSMLYGMALFNLLEYRVNGSRPNAFVWDFIGWFGGDYNRLWVKSEGSQDLNDSLAGTADVQLLYGRMIAPFWTLQVGARSKFNLGSGFENSVRTYGVIGMQGLAPGNFEVEPAIYVSDRGEVSAELVLSVDLYLTQRLILQPRFQGEISIQGDDRFGTGSGVTETDIGLRLRYEIRREIAPYIGVSWLRNYGETAQITRQSGESSGTVAFVAGVRLWW